MASVLEVGANVGRNLHWIRRALPRSASRAFDVAGQNVTEGRSLFGFTPDELWVGDERSLTSLPDDYVDLVFTVSVLDHIPDVATSLAEMLRRGQDPGDPGRTGTSTPGEGY